ncbi:MAG: hypothetical protein LBK57_11420 [Clostridiales Family XIII bacterium]|nr:hypothetical protein [Clostridiales Family XIII bacterium]
MYIRCAYEQMTSLLGKDEVTGSNPVGSSKLSLTSAAFSALGDARGR